MHKYYVLYTRRYTYSTEPTFEKLTDWYEISDSEATWNEVFRNINRNMSKNSWGPFSKRQVTQEHLVTDSWRTQNWHKHIHMFSRGHLLARTAVSTGPTGTRAPHPLPTFTWEGRVANKFICAYLSLTHPIDW